jgi:glycosyltransferase involved in cell wall biosynthesis
LNNKYTIIISGVFPPEPVVSAKLSFDLAENLAKEKNVVVISPAPTRPYKFNFGEKKNCVAIGFNHIIANSYTCPKSRLIGRMRESYSFGKYCYRFIQKNKDTIDCIYANAWPLFAQLLIVRAAKKNNIPIALHIQDIYPESLSNKTAILDKALNVFLRPVDRYILKNATAVIAISDKMKNHLSKTRNIDAAKIKVVPNWQDETGFVQHRQTQRSQPAQERPFTFMYLGNIGPVAGVNLLIDAFVQADIPNSQLIIAGSGSMREQLEKKCEALNFRDIEFGDVPEGKVPEVQAQADVLLLPVAKGAASSSIPSKLPAYMFSAKPVIACVDENTDTANAIMEANCGWVLPPEDANRLSAMMKEVSTLPQEILKEKGEKGFNYGIRNFSKEKNLRKLIKIVSELYKI